MSDVEIPDSAHEYFTQVIPAQFKETIAGHEDGPGSICFDLVGEGQWSLTVKGGEIDVTDGRHDDTIVEITFDGSNWKEAVKRMQEGGAGPMSGDGLGNMLGNPAVASTLKAAQGTLKLVTTTDSGDEWVAITFGGAEANLDQPRATLTMSREVAEKMSKGEANPQELFMSGQIQIAGDMMMLMQLAPIMQ
ncbi:MAG: SCP2 sterol-binding domain-containing protein [Acidimicrobiia bacterium]|nr:SCP2 sterol-binding domain-containing protein [Acidimicrobiia bacterium]